MPSSTDATVPYRLGFAVKVLGATEPLKESDNRRWQSGPHLRHSIELLHGVWDHLERIGVRMYRMSSSVIPYGTHPDLPEFDYRRQIDDCADDLAELGARARALGLRLSTHPGQYTVINGSDDGLRDRSLAELESNALLFDAMGMGPESTVVVHVGGLYGDRASALDRWTDAWGRLSDTARRRVGLENDERLFHAGDVLELHRRTGVRVVYDWHHARIHPAPGLADADALAAAMASWPDGVRPKVHLSSPRVSVDLVKRPIPGTRRRRDVVVPPALGPHADLVSPWDFIELIRSARGPLDVMLEAKAKDVALLWLRGRLAVLAPEVAAAEE
ncbi:MAG: UV DNA damage repair endonuclease UvsE [Chloroflexi bacterium]|nr:UV DNA damage repair endonuclease UvsE [Chloroflexota bacterium]